MLEGMWPWALSGAGLALALLLWRRRPWAGARTRYPVVLCHGLLGFDTLGVGALKQDYFRGVAAHLEGLGVRVIRARVSPVASIAARAEQLAAVVRAVDARRVNLVAHSMGGLDARYAISRLGLAPRVASLVTIGTPHLGTRVADVGTLGLGSVLGRVGLGALGDLTAAAAEAFNRQTPDRWWVRYGCVLCRTPADGAGVHPLLMPSSALLRSQGPNDGLVTERSQRWGRVLFSVVADHWSEIGWSGGLDAPAMYERVARKLRAWGC
jgi:triacylglycerol lipase